MPSALALTTLGVFHTAISLAAIVAGAWALARDKVIVLNWLGKLYLATTALTAVTGLMMFRHDAWRIGHSFSVLTLAVLAIGTVAAATPLFGRASRYVQAAFFTATMLIHMITGLAETLTRLPPGAPLITAANASIFKGIIGGLVFLYLVGTAAQLWWLRRQLIQERNAGDIRR
jgi:hypothetical protein